MLLPAGFDMKFWRQLTAQHSSSFGVQEAQVYLTALGAQPQGPLNHSLGVLDKEQLGTHQKPWSSRVCSGA